MTFNIRYDEPADGPHAWRHRRDLAIEAIRAPDPDLVALQESTMTQWDEIAAALPEYSAFGIWQDEWGGAEPHGGFFRTDRFEARDSGIFWLSDTPEVAQSISWPNDWGPRACAWVRVVDRRGDRALIFASTHVDTNAGSWLRSARVLHRELERVARGSAIVLAGDFNCAAGSPAHHYLLNDAGFHDAWYDAGRADAGVVTYHGFTGATRLSEENLPVNAPANERIDWILLRRPLVARDVEIDCRRAGDRLPSDHYPIVARIKWADAT